MEDRGLPAHLPKNLVKYVTKIHIIVWCDNASADDGAHNVA